MTYDDAYKKWREECETIAQECAEEGYPSYGENYDLRAGQAWEYWRNQIDDEEE